MVANILLTIAEAAERLGVPRPYASMLADKGKLGAVAEKDGRRAATVSAVDAYLRAQAQKHAGAKTPREAAAEANLYDLEFDVPALNRPVERNLASRHVNAPGGNVFADLGFNAEEAQRLLEDADERLLAETIRSLAEKGSSTETDFAFDPPQVDIKAKPADLDD